MKNALILHGTMGSPDGNWFRWLESELVKKGYKVWVPKLQKSEKPRVSENVDYIFKRKWKFDRDSVLVGHSSSPATIWAILQELPDDVIVSMCIFVSAFIKSDWEANSELFDYKYDWKKIKRHSKKFILIHSDNDPYTPLSQAKMLAKNLNGELIIKEGQGHFNLEKGPEYKKFPFLLKLIENE